MDIDKYKEVLIFKTGYLFYRKKKQEIYSKGYRVLTVKYLSSTQINH